MGNKMLLLEMGRKQYCKKIRNLFGTSLIGYWPLNEPSGSVAYDISGNGKHGVYTGVTLAGATNSLTHKSCPVWDGANSRYVSLNSAGITQSFSEGTQIHLVKPDADTVSALGPRMFGHFSAAAGGTMSFGKLNAVHSFGELHFSGDYKIYNQYSHLFDTGWYLVISTWSITNNTAKVYINGNLAVSSTFTVASSNTPNIHIIGSDSATTGTWKGSISDVVYINRYTTPTEALQVFNALFGNYSYTVSLLGDSVTTSVIGWQNQVFGGYKNGKTKIINHAVGGTSIMSGLDAQVVAAASDNADVIILQQGTNDNNAGNMATLQAEVEENIIELKASNPFATIYYMNVFKRWADQTAGAEIDKSNIRIAISAACTAQGITCWDTYTSPWFAQNETSDGLHPTVAGHSKIATEVLARI